MKKISILLFLIIIKITTWAQTDSDRIDPIQIELKAIILSSADSTGIPYANIVLQRTYSGAITNRDGFFSLEMLNIDSLEVTSIGFKKLAIKIPPYYRGYETLTFYMQPILYNVGEVTVSGSNHTPEFFEHGKPTDTPVELRGDAFNSKPSLFQSLKSPGSSLQYFFSRKEKEKRKVRASIEQNKQWKAFSEIYNKEVIMEVTGLNEAYADTFMIWLNAQKVLSYSDSEYKVKTSISKYFPEFKKAYKLK